MSGWKSRIRIRNDLRNVLPISQKVSAVNMMTDEKIFYSALTLERKESWWHEPGSQLESIIEFILVIVSWRKNHPNKVSDTATSKYENMFCVLEGGYEAIFCKIKEIERRSEFYTTTRGLICARKKNWMRWKSFFHSFIN